MSGRPVGFVGLGSMGAVLAHNLVASGHDVLTHDIAGAGRSPDGARSVDAVADVVAACDTIVLSLPDGRASEQVAGQIVDAVAHPAHVVDTSTIEKYAAGFANHLMAKDVGLYLDEVAASGCATDVATLTAAIWRRFADAEPGADFTAIYPFVRSS